MSKDNENIELTIMEPETSDFTSAQQPFAPEQMVSCEECLRANPPTRVNCIYCGTVLPLTESAFDLQKPALRRLEKWELGYNNILVPRSANGSAKVESDLTDAADVLKLTVAEVARILTSNSPLPLARAATADEATLVQRRLRSYGIETRVIADSDLGLTETGPLRVRALHLDEEELRAFQTPESQPVAIAWSELFLLVVGRVISTRVELKEENGSRSENRILDSSEFFSDEMVFDFYAESHPVPFRVSANSFDFSCLEERKQLVSGQNMQTLTEIFRERAPQIEVDESYRLMRKIVEPVWPLEQQVESTGWKRERPGKYNIGSVAAKSNDTQFIRYSLLRRYLHQQDGANENI